MMLTVRAAIEKKFFYPAAPAAREADVDSGLLHEAEVEHNTAKDLIAQIRAMKTDDNLTTRRSLSWASTSTTTSNNSRI